MGLAALSNMTALSKRNDDPATASRPFDFTRDGFVRTHAPVERNRGKARRKPKLSRTSCKGTVFSLGFPGLTSYV
jgi:hypothetical protein